MEREITNEPIEKNQFTQEWLEDFEKAGFTWAQLRFLEKWYKSPESIDELI